MEFMHQNESFLTWSVQLKFLFTPKSKMLPFRFTSLIFLLLPTFQFVCKELPSRNALSAKAKKKLATESLVNEKLKVLNSQIVLCIVPT